MRALMRNRFILRSSVAMLFLALATVLGYFRGSDELLPARDLIGNFQRTAFGSELDKDAPRVILKWRYPIRAAIYTDNADLLDRRGVIPATQQLVRRLSAQSEALSLTMAADEPLDLLSEFSRRHNMDGINLRIVFYDDPEILGYALRGLAQWVPTIGETLLKKVPLQTSGDVVCSFGVWYFGGPSAGLGFAVLLIPLKHSQVQLDYCLDEELTQALGLINDSDANAGSIFTDMAGTPGKLTVNDLLLLRVLYDRRLVHGMPEAAAMAVAPAIIREHRSRMAAEPEHKKHGD